LEFIVQHEVKELGVHILICSVHFDQDGESKFFESASEALAYLREMLTEGDIVLVKSSKSANLRHLGDDLLEVSA
jgi:UDP-N-acetylmuramyl pentapeptide synthase